jgi:hypothetical protein
MGLVMWITIHVKGISNLLHYMDDAWSYNMDPMLGFYPPYNAFLPHKQAGLLLL